MKSDKILRFAKLAAGALLPGLLLWGCASANQGGATTVASVKITGSSVEAIRDTAKVVFNEKGYGVVYEGTTAMKFERFGSTGDALKYGGWDGSGVVMRAGLNISGSGEDAHLVRCEASAVRDAGDAFFEEENRVMLLGRGQYQRILNEIRKRLERR